MRDKNGQNTRPPAALSDPAMLLTAVSLEERRDMGGRFTTSGGKLKSQAAGKRVDKS